MYDDTVWTCDQPRLETLYPRLRYNALDFFYGVEEESGELLRGALPHETSLLLLGKPGSGKTCLAGAILCQLYATNGPEELQVIFFDSYQQISPLFAGFPQTSAIAWRANQVEAALQQPFQSMRGDSNHSPFWLIVIDVIDRAMYEEGRIWPILMDLPTRFARDGTSGRRGGLIVISADPLPFFPPFRTTLILGHDRRQINLRRRRNARELDLLRRLASAPYGQFLIERRRGARKIGVTPLIMAPEAALTSPLNHGKYWPPTPRLLSDPEGNGRDN